MTTGFHVSRQFPVVIYLFNLCCICLKLRIRTNLGVSDGLVGCIESLRIASPTLNIAYDLHMPGSDDIESLHGIRAYLLTNNIAGCRNKRRSFHYPDKI